MHRRRARARWTAQEIWHATWAITSGAAHHTEALELRRQIGDPRDIARSLGNLGVIAHDRRGTPRPRRSSRGHPILARGR
jgi:hypothetical protein